MPRFDDILARSVLVKEKDPHTEAVSMEHARAQFAALGKCEPILLIRAQAYEGIMRLELGGTECGERLLVAARRLSERVGVGYFSDTLSIGWR
jgi:hypothetical protein